MPISDKVRKAGQLPSGPRAAQCRDVGRLSAACHMRCRFAASGDVQRHIVIHSGEKPHLCDTCGRGMAALPFPPWGYCPARAGLRDLSWSPQASATSAT